MKKAKTIKGTRGKACNKESSQKAKVRKNNINGSEFVGAFCQSNVGDVTPNVVGAFCIDSGKPCDFNHSSCHGNDQLCVGRGPGYANLINLYSLMVKISSINYKINFLWVLKFFLLMFVLI